MNRHGGHVDHRKFSAVAVSRSRGFVKGQNGFGKCTKAFSSESTASQRIYKRAGIPVASNRA